ncbi:amino acid adenylation domain-containing protein, partial [Amycolatopsis sp. lyj-90]|uniref:amino acid adenylation domain-containing protein n=1 Tax=Amycolatopsis sp. lyj-90 TaxID=2789285 RepID=UPI00397CA820
MMSTHSLELLSSLTAIPHDELRRAPEMLISTLGLDSLAASRIRGALDPQPTYQTLFGLTIEQVVNRLDESKGHEVAVSDSRSPEEGSQSYPLSPMQESYALGAQQGQPCVVYHEFDVRNLNVSAFQEAVRVVVENEPMLSAVLSNGSKQKIERCESYGGPQLLEAERAADPEERRKAYVDDLLQEEDRHWIVELTQPDKETIRIHLALDMLFIDATSVVMLCERVSEQYGSLVTDGRPAELSGSAQQFFEYCSQLKNSDPSPESVSYWEAKCVSFPEPPQIPRSRRQSDDGEPSFLRETTTLPKEYWNPLKEKAKSLQITSNSLLVSAFAETVRLYSANSTFALAVTTSNRPVQIGNDFSGSIGEFTDVALCSVEKETGESVFDQAVRLHEQMITAMDHGDVSGLDFIRMLRSRNDDPHLSYPVVFTSFLGIVTGAIELQDATVSLNYQSTQTPQIHLDCQVYEMNEDLVVNWDYDGNVYSSAQMSEMLKCLHRLLQGLTFDDKQTAYLDTAIVELRNRQNQTFREWGDRGRLLLHELVLEAAGRHPQATAIIDQDVQIDYRTMIKLSNSIAVRLQENGVRTGAAVAILQEKGWEQVVSAIGVLLAGAHYIPINATDPIDRIRSVIKQSNCAAILTHGASISIGRDVSESSGLSVVPAVVNVDKQMVDHVGSLQAPVKPVGQDELAYIIFTSGSTGMPKGVEITHAGAVNTCLDINEKVEAQGKVVTFGISALSFDLSVWDIFGTLSTGGTLVVCRPDGVRDPDYWQQQIAEHDISVWNSVPTTFEMLLATDAGPSLLNDPIKTVLLSGDAISMAMANRTIEIQPDIKLFALGGATEASIWSNYHLFGKHSNDLGTDLVPYGRPLSNQTMYVLNEELGYTPDGVVGEIHIGGRGLAEGYFKQPSLTAASFIQTGAYGRLYRTGDLGRYLKNGEIEILGRRDSQVKVGGHRIELSEIEVCAEQLPEVTKAAAIRVTEPAAGIVGFVATTYDGPDFEGTIRNHVEERLPSYMSPQSWFLLPQIPLTANNKVDAKALREIARSARPVVQADLNVDEADLVLEILHHAASVLDVSSDSLSDDLSLADQGLTSLYAVELVNRLRETWGTRLPYTAIFNYTSARALAAHHANASPRQADELTASGKAARDLGSHDEPIAVIASACRLPGDANSADEFWHMLLRKSDCMSDVPDSRFDIDEIYSPDPNVRGGSYSRRGAFISGAERFDHEFFGIPLAEVQSMDPQQRLLVEVAYEALYAAGYGLDELRGSSTGVFAGQMNYDWMMDFGHSKEYASTGVAPSITSNRISYILDLNGPSMTVDTACSSSLVALDLAVQKLRNNSCRLALVGGANLILSPEPYVFTSQARMLSVDSRCATFDESANGMARGEGVGAVVLKRLCDAEADGDQVLAVIRGTAVNQDGRSASLTAPSGLAQEAVIGRALAEAGVRGGDVDFVECHGTGTPLGDPIEVEALRNVLGVGRVKPVVLGAVKSNIGHLEGAAGIVGLIKAIEVLRHREAPGNLHFTALNPKIDLSAFDAVIPTESTPLASEGKLIAGVSSFGFGGTNAHVVLESYDQPRHVTGRPLRQDVWFFTGQGSLKSGAALPLYESNGTFRNALSEYCRELSRWFEAPVLDWLITPSSEATAMLRETQFQQPALIALQLAQVDMWKERNFHPAVVVGHSIGELAAAVAAGVMTASEALESAVNRGRLMSEARPGAMAAVRASIDELTPWLPREVSIAAENGPRSTVLAGPSDALQEFLRERHPGAHAMLDVSHAFHSSMMQNAAADFYGMMQNVELKSPDSRVTFISTLSGVIEEKNLQTAEYWRDQIISPVLYNSAIETLFELFPNVDTIVEIGPGTTLIDMAKSIAPNVDVRWYGSKEATTGIPELSPLRPTSIPWERPAAKRPVVKSSSVVGGVDCVYSVGWVGGGGVSGGLFSGVGVVLCSSGVDVVVPEGWVCRVVVDGDSVEEVLGEREWGCVAFLSGGRESDVVVGLRVLQVCLAGEVVSPGRVVLLPVAGGVDDAGLWGLARTARLERPDVVVDCVEVGVGDLPRVLSGCLEPDCRVSASGVEVLRLGRVDVGGGGFVARGDVSYVVSGGLGALGLVTAEFLVESGARHVVLLSRTGYTESELPAKVVELRRSARVECFVCDVSDAGSVRRVHGAMVDAGLPVVAGVVHAAGVLTDGVLGNQSGRKLNQAYGAKVRGARNLRAVFAPSDFLVLYSSAAAVFGSPGQASYAAANATLDALARSWSELGEPVLSVQWGAWSEAGMATRHQGANRAQAAGYGTINNKLGTQTLGHLLAAKQTGVVCVSPIDWDTYVSTTPLTTNLSSTAVEPVKDQSSRSWTREDLSRVVWTCLKKFTPSADMDPKLPFMEAGLSSLDLVQFRQAILTELPKSVELPAHFAFNYPTVQEVVDHLHAQLAEASLVEEMAPTAWKHLNDVHDGPPLFLIGGVMGSAEKTFGTLAQALSIPVYATMPAIPAEPLPADLALESIASDLREAMIREVPTRQYAVGGLSFGATLALEVGLQLEQTEMLSRLVLLDPRHMAPFKAPVDAAPFELLLERYSPQGSVVSPTMVFQCEVPPVDRQSEMMLEASRSFQSSSEIVDRCVAHSSNLEIVPTEGHHFNFLYKHCVAVARRIEEAALGSDSSAPAVAEPIAVVGSACRLPGAVGSPGEFWEMLRSGVDGVGEIPVSRFDIGEVFDPNPDAVGRSYTRRGAFMDDVEHFDNEFFELALAEAKMMDPQQRVMLEVAFESLHSAGFDRDSLRGAPVGVYIGLANDDWSSMGRDSQAHNPFFGAGVSGSIMSNRVSYCLGLTGPSMTVDTACSSSLVAIDLAVEKLRTGACSAALVGGVNVMLHHRMYVSACATKALSRDGRCATFDESADGYCRGEGVGAVVLKRLCDAEADGDQVLAVIRGTAVNQDGRSASLTAPSGLAQEAVIGRALAEAGVRGGDVDFVECHGTGTPLGDPIEVEALRNVLGVGRVKPVVLGAVKSNIGHLEGAAGIVGLIKAIEVLRHREAPGNLHFTALNPKIDLSAFDAVIPTESTPLASEGKLIAGVSSFGFGGTNAHVVLESYDQPHHTPPPARVEYARTHLPWRRLPNPLLGRVDGQGFAASLEGGLAKMWEDHRIGGKALIPAASHITMMGGAALLKSEEVREPAGVEVGDIIMVRPFVVGAGEVSIHCNPDGAQWVIEDSSRERYASCGTSRTLNSVERNDDLVAKIASIAERCTAISTVSLYSTLNDDGVEFGERYRNVDELYLGEREVLGRIRVSVSESSDRSATLLNPETLDAGIQLLGFYGMKTLGACLPFSIRSARVYKIDAQPVDLWAHANITDIHSNGIEGTVTLLDDNGEIYAVLEGISCRKLQSSSVVGGVDCVYSVGWVGGGGVSGGLFSGVGVVLCGSGVDVVVPEGWVCRVVV